MYNALGNTAFKRSCEVVYVEGQPLKTMHKPYLTGITREALHNWQFWSYRSLETNCTLYYLKYRESRANVCDFLNGQNYESLSDLAWCLLSLAQGSCSNKNLLFSNLNGNLIWSYLFLIRLNLKQCQPIAFIWYAAAFTLAGICSTC